MRSVLRRCMSTDMRTNIIILFKQYLDRIQTSFRNCVVEVFLLKLRLLLLFKFQTGFKYCTTMDLSLEISSRTTLQLVWEYNHPLSLLQILGNANDTRIKPQVNIQSINKMYTLALIQFLPVLTLTTTSSVVVETISNLYFI